MTKTIVIPVVDDLNDLTDVQIAEVMKLEKLLLSMFKASKDIALKRLTDGRKVPGWELAPGRRSRAWKDEQAAIDAMTAAGINDPYKRALYSPSEAEKQLPEIHHAELAEGYEWHPGKPTMKQTVAGQTTSFDLSVFDGVNAEDAQTKYGW